VNGSSTFVAAVGGSVSGCTSSGASLICHLTATVPVANSMSVTAQGFASADGSGTPLEMGAGSAVGTPGGSSAVALAWQPVVASLTTGINGKFAAGVASAVNVSVTAKDAAGTIIPTPTNRWLNTAGAAVSIALTNSDTSGKTQLASSAYTGTAVSLSYDGDLPLPNPITVTVSGGSAIPATPASVVQPTASKSFTFSFGGSTTLVQNNTAVPTNVNNVDYWNAIPDSKIAIVTVGSKHLISWGNQGWAVSSDSPYPESANGTSYMMYSPQTIQNYEQAGWWFRDVMPLNNPYHPTDSNDLVSFYHAESDFTGPHTKTVGVSYSHDGGKTWSPGQQILAPNAYTSGVGISSADHGSIYDPVNKRWVIFFTAIDPSPNISGHLSEAVSDDPLGAPGSWHKLYNGAFTQPGLQGQETSLTAVQNQGYISSPTISWNSYLNLWVMIADWGDVGEALMTSPDLYTWSTPIKLMDGTNLGYIGGTSAYPTLVGDNDDKITGQTSRLYFAEFSNSDPRIYGRVMLMQQLTFQRND
jgi:hypothetical protein